MSILEVLEIVVFLIFIATLVGIGVRRFRMPYTVGLVLVGLALALMGPFFPEFAREATPEAIRRLILPQLILGLFVPPLVFDAASHIRFDQLRRNLPLILTFAIPGVVLTMFMVGGVISWGTDLAMPVALVFGALIAATDPVAVVALFRSLGVPKRLQVLLEGESLFNDGTAIVIFNLMLAIVSTGEFSLIQGILEFLQVAVGGLIVGFVVSSLTSFIISRIDDYLLEITLTAVAAYGSYLIAEQFHLSGILAAVMAGLVSGNTGPRSMSPTTRIAASNFWEYAAFLANSFVFLLIGLVIDLNAVVANWRAILLAIAAVLAARAVVIYLFSTLSRNIPLRFQHVIYWGGLRGAISLALALSLPAGVLGDDLSLLQAMAFGVVLFTILGQGTTMGVLVRRLRLIERTDSEVEYQLRQARAVAAQSAYVRVKRLSEEGLISEHAWELLEEPMRLQIESHTQAVREILHADRSVELAELNNAFNEGLRAQRSTYNSLFTSGAISEEIFSQLISEIDSALIGESTPYTNLLLTRGKDRAPIRRLIAAVIGEYDIDNALNMLHIMGIPTTQIDSTSGASGSQRVTVLIGVETGQEQEVVNALCNACAEEPHFGAEIMGSFLPVQSQEQVLDDNVSIYVLDIEHYEEF